MRARFVVCANGTLAKPKLASHRRHGDLRGPLVPHLALGLRATPAPSWRTSPTSGSASSAPGPARCRSSPTSGPEGEGAVRLPADAVVDRHPRRLGDRPGVGGQARSRDGRPSGGPRSWPSSEAAWPSGGRGSIGITQEEKVRRQENANIDAMMRIHRRIDEVVEDPAKPQSRSSRGTC